MLPYEFLTPGNALIFRIVHIDNIEWILSNGLHCCNSDIRDPSFIDIGNSEIIDRRLRRTIGVEPYGTLSDYIPFYFTPSSIMLYNILTGHNVPQKQRSDLIILVTQLTVLHARGIRFVFSDRHALLIAAQFDSDLGNLGTAVDWQFLQKRDFSRNNEDPGKLERYQAEALIYRHLPVDALSGLACAVPETTEKITSLLQKRNLSIKVTTQPEWFFS